MDQSDIDEAPKVRLGKKDWSIPELSPRQIIKITGRMSHLQHIRLNELTEQDIEALYDIVFIALQRAHPDVDREKFDDMPIKPRQLMNAFPVIMRQSGLDMKETEPGKAEAQSPSTGTA